MAIRDLLSTSVVRLVIKTAANETDQIYQTAWFFSADGALLTAGHGFRDQCATKGDSFAVSHPASGWNGTAILDEFGSGRSGEWDYAILHIIGGMPPGLSHVPVSNQVFKPRLPSPQSIIGYGHSQDLSGRTITFEGKLQGQSHESGADLRTRSQIDTLGNEAPGLSGGPICVEYKSPASGAVALQVMQGGKSKTKYLFFAQSLCDVYQQSQLFRKLIAQQNERDTLRRWPLYKLERKILAHIEPPVDRKLRWVWSLRPLNADMGRANIADVVQGRTNRFLEGLATFLESLAWLDPKQKCQPLHPRFQFRGWEQEEGTPNLGIFLDPTTSNIPEADLPYVRVLCDLTGDLDFEAPASFPRAARSSHLVGVRFLAPATRWLAPKHTNLDLILEVDGDATAAPDIALHVIEDLLLDANIFYCLPCLPQLFRGSEGMRAFSAAKVAFVQARGLAVDGMQLPTDGARFVAVSGCARQSFHTPIDARKLEQVWRDFINDFLFPSLLARTDGLAPAVTDAEAVSLFCSAKKVGGQLSRRRLQQRLAKLEAPSGELCALAKVVAEPKHDKERRALRKLFAPGIRLSRGIGAFSSAQLPLLCRFQPYVRLMLFRRG